MLVRPANPLQLVELEAPLADGQEVVSKQGTESVGVGVQLGVVEGPLELKDVICHAVVSPWIRPLEAVIPRRSICPIFLRTGQSGRRAAAAGAGRGGQGDAAGGVAEDDPLLAQCPEPAAQRNNAVLDHRSVPGVDRVEGALTGHERRRVLTTGGRLIVAVDHPFAIHALRRLAGHRTNYFATYNWTEEWTMGGQTAPVSFWNRPLHAMTDAFTAAGFRISIISEPQPAPAARELFPMNSVSSRPAQASCSSSCTPTNRRGDQRSRGRWHVDYGTERIFQTNTEPSTVMTATDRYSAG
jgi:hypothetical protein